MPALRLPTALFIGAIIPPLVSMLVWTGYFKLAPEDLVEGVSFRIYALLALLVIGYELLRGICRRSVWISTLWCGVLLTCLQGVAWYGFRFSGLAAVGSDEQITEYYRSGKGAFTSPPRIPLKVVAVTSEPQSVTVFHEGEETTLAAGGTSERYGYLLTLQSVEHAPLVSVWRSSGEPVDEAYLKLTSSGDREDFIMFGKLPHRFYVKPAESAKGGVAAFHLKVVRDKLIIVDRTVNDGESVYFDGHFVTCRPGADWARIAVEKRQSLTLLYTGGLLTAAGLIGTIAARRREKA